MIGERILHMLNEAGLSIEGLGTLSGMEEDHIRDIIAGTSRPRRGILQRIADVLDTDVDDLYGRRDDSPYNRSYQLNRADLGNTYDAIDEYVRAGAAFC